MVMNRNAEDVRAGYEVIAETYHAGRAAREQVNVEWLGTLRPLLPQSGKVVDLGCGGGVPISRYFADRGYQVTGYDLSPAMIDLARREAPEALFDVAAIESLALEPGSVDLVTSFFAIIHIDRALHAEIFRRIFTWLKPGGVCLLSLGANDNPDDYQPDWHGAPMRWSHFDAETNVGLLEDAGFELRWREVEDLAGEQHLFVIAAAPESGSAPAHDNVGQ